MYNFKAFDSLKPQRTHKISFRKFQRISEYPSSPDALHERKRSSNNPIFSIGGNEAKEVFGTLQYGEHIVNGIADPGI